MERARSDNRDLYTVVMLTGCNLKERGVELMHAGFGPRGKAESNPVGTFISDDYLMRAADSFSHGGA